MYRRYVLYLLGLVVLCAVAAPMALYWLGLSGIDGFPNKPITLASQQQQTKVWEQAQGMGEPKVSPLNPYSYALLIFGARPKSYSAGIRVAWWAASDYLFQHQLNKGMGWWHLSGASLTIWLSRNWSTEELLTKASEHLSQPSEKNSAVTPVER